MSSENEELLKAKDGDLIAIENLLNKYKSLVSIISRQYFLVGGDAEDLFQEGMIGLYKAIITFKENQNFYKFAKLCIERQIQTAVKTANRLKFKPLNEALFYFNNTVDNSAKETEFTLISNELGPDEKIIEKEKYLSFNRKIDSSLTKLEKLVLKLYLEGLSYNEISLKINKPKKSVDNALIRIKSKILNIKNEEVNN